MSDWTNRISVAQAADMFRHVLRSGHVVDESAYMLHDLGMLKQRIARLDAAFPPHCLHALAIKANPLVNVLRVAQRAGSGLEAASLEEVHLGLKANCPPGRIVFDSPAKTVRELEFALELGVHLNADNFSELARIDDILQRRTSNSTIGLRVNPQVGSGTIATTSVAGAVSRFGIPISRKDEIGRAFARYPWLRGLHAHVGSQGCAPTQLFESAERLAELRRQVHAVLREDRITVVDIGGGLPVSYHDQEVPMTVESYADGLRQRVPELWDSSVQLVTEFGRAVQAGCGLAFSRVEYVKDGGDLAVVHFGADLFLRWVYHPHDWHHDLFVVDADGNPKQGDLRPIAVAGPLCFGGDFLDRKVLLPPVVEGDWLGMRDVGAYTLSMWSRHCSRGLPLVLGYESDGDVTISVLRRREQPADVVDFWS